MSAEALQTADKGYGPLLQRDYWAVIKNCRFAPSEIIQLVSSRIGEFAPETSCRFTRAAEVRGKPLEKGEMVEVDIPVAMHCKVRITHVDSNSFTFSTAAGHPEAGKITFGAYRNSKQDVIFHIRSHARSKSAFFYAGFQVFGEAMQTTTWAEFVNRVAATVGDGALSSIHTDTQELASTEELEASEGPTFIAEGD